MATVRKEITTSEILESLKGTSDHTKFFYLYVSTSDRKDKRQKSRQLPAGQQTLADKFVQEEEDSDDTESSGEDNDEPINSLPQPVPQLSVQENPVVNGPALPSPSTEKARKQAMSKVHNTILPGLLCPHGWQKVHDKDQKINYRALYFNTIEKKQNEDDIAHIQRVAQYREMIREKVDTFKKERGVNFKIDSLLSRPLLYDPGALQEQSMREGSTKQK